MFHLLYDTSIVKEQHNIQAEEMEVNERRADYFAAKMLLGDVYKYYYSLQDDEFINKIVRCMDVFNDISLKKLIIDNFDKKPNLKFML